MESRTREAGPAGIYATGHADGASRYTSHRKPSMTLAVILMSQLQFLATLSLVDYIVEEEPWLRVFCARLRWVNLWWPASFVNDSTAPSDTTRRVLTENSLGDSGDIGYAVTVGNLTLIFGLLPCIFILHLLVVSGVEAYWLSKRQAILALTLAQRRNITVDELYFRTFGANHGERVRQQRSTVMPCNGPDTEFDCFSDKRKMSPPQSTSEAPHNVSSFGKSRILDIGYASEEHGSDEEYGGVLVRQRRQRPVNLIAECRETSDSAWLYFPHVELLFLLFAFQGVVAAQVAAVRNGQHTPLRIVASFVLVLYPALMLACICRTIAVRLCSEETVLFREISPEDDVGSLALSSSAVSSGARGLFSRADKGSWCTALTANEIVRHERNWFRIGFEPLFVDFTQSGNWFMVLFLVECAMLACVGVLVDSSIIQLFLFSSISAASCVAVVACRPFSNKIIDGIAASVAFTNAACMALMTVSALTWDGTPNAEKANLAVAIVQFLLLCALSIPAYLDLTSAIICALSRFTTTTKNAVQSGQTEGDNINALIFERRFTRRIWARTWCTLLGHNLCIFTRDTYKGLSRPEVRRHIAPYLALDTDSLGTHVPSRYIGANVVGTFVTPVVVAGDATSSIVTKEALSKGKAEGIEKQGRFNLHENSEMQLGEVIMERKVEAAETVPTTRSQMHVQQRGKPVEIDLPHRRSGYTFAVDNIGLLHGHEIYRSSTDGASADDDGLQSTLHTSGVRTVRWEMKRQGPIALDLPRRRSITARPMDLRGKGEFDQNGQMIDGCRGQKPVSLTNEVRPLHPRILQGGQAREEKDDNDQQCGSSKEAQQDEKQDNKFSQMSIDGGRRAPRSSRPIAVDLPEQIFGDVVGAESSGGSELEYSKETPTEGPCKESIGNSKMGKRTEGRSQAGYWGKRIREPIATDLPRRNEDRSTDSTNNGKAKKYIRHLYHLDNTETLKRTDHIKETKSTLGVWDRATQEPVPIDVPRRRPSYHLVPETEEVVENRSGGSTNSGQVDQHTRRLHQLDNTEDLKRTDRSKETKSTLGVWDRATQEPVPIDVPRRRPSYHLVPETEEVVENRSGGSTNSGQVDQHTRRLHQLDNTEDLKRTDRSKDTKLSLGM